MQTDRNLNNLNQSFRDKVKKFLSEAKLNWIDIFVTEWRRSIERQHFLFWKGRTAAQLAAFWVSTKYAQPALKQVTRTLQSNHITWKAIDIAFNPSSHGGLYPVDDRLRSKLGNLALSNWISRGYKKWWVDKPHFEDSDQPLPVKEIIMFYQKIREDHFSKTHSRNNATFIDVDQAIDKIVWLPNDAAIKELLYLNAILFAKIDIKLWKNVTE